MRLISLIEANQLIANGEVLRNTDSLSLSHHSRGAQSLHPPSQSSLIYPPTHAPTHWIGEHTAGRTSLYADRTSLHAGRTSLYAGRTSLYAGRSSLYA